MRAAFLLPYMTLTLVTLPTAQEAKPLGAWFGDYQKLAFDAEFAWGSDAYVVTHYANEHEPSFSSTELDKYSGVLIGPRAGRVLSSVEQAALQSWIRHGGHLIVSVSEAQMILGNPPPDVGDRPQTRRQGEGTITFLGNTTIPQRRPAVQEKVIVRDLTPQGVQNLRGLMNELSIPRRHDVIEQWAQTSRHETDAMILWWRYQRETPLGGRLYAPPHPRDGEELKQLTFDVGINERSRRSIFVTGLRDLIVTVRHVANAASSGRSPAPRFRVYAQHKPAPSYPKGSYWLVPLDDDVTLRANETNTIWIEVDTTGVRPGRHRGVVEFRRSDTSEVVQRLPVVIKVWNVQHPGSESLHFEMEHCWFTMPGGYWIEKDRNRKVAVRLDDTPLVETPLNDPTVLGNYIAALAELGVDFAQSWGDVSRLYVLQFVRMRDSGRLLSEEIDKHPDRFRGERLPSLDFSVVFDSFFDRAVAAGMRYYAMNYSLTLDGSLALARQITGDPNLSVDSDFAGRIRTWYWSQFATYVKERGLLGVYAKILDEFGPKTVPEFIRSAQGIRPAGFKSYTTTYNFDRDSQAVAQIEPHLDLWQIGWELAPRRRLGSAFENRNEIWGTTASSYWGNYMDYARAAGWVAARLRYQGLHTHGYMRWHWNDHEGCFPGPDRPYNSVAAISYAEGINEGRYLAQLYDMLDTARQSRTAVDLADAVQRELESGIIGTDSDCLLQLRDQPDIPGGGFVEYWWPTIATSPAVYRAAKVRVFELTERMKAALGDLPTSVLYGNFPLVQDGKFCCHIVGDTTNVKRLANMIESLSGRPSDETPATSKHATVLVGTLTGNAELARFVRENLPGEFTPHYPRADHYAIRRHRETVLIVGGNENGVVKGVNNFLRLLTVDNRW